MVVNFEDDVFFFFFFFQARFDGQCILYASFGIFGIMRPGPDSTCDYPLYVSVVGLVVHGFLMGAFYIYSFVISKREPNRG